MQSQTLVNNQDPKARWFDKLGRSALTVAALVTVVRVAQLALVARQDSTAMVKLPETSAAPGFAGGSATGQRLAGIDATDSTPGKAGGCATAPTDAELAELYAACPLAAVIDWQTVAQSPDRAAALLPPYRETADHVREVVDEGNIPRIRYPVQVEVPPPAEIRVAQLPAKRSWELGPRLAAANPVSPSGSAPGNPNLGGWLIDPNEWFTPSKTPTAAAASPGALNEEPSAQAAPPTESQPADKPLPPTPAASPATVEPPAAAEVQPAPAPAPAPTVLEPTKPVSGSPPVPASAPPSGVTEPQQSGQSQHPGPKLKDQGVLPLAPPQATEIELPKPEPPNEELTPIDEHPPIPDPARPTPSERTAQPKATPPQPASPPAEEQKGEAAPAPAVAPILAPAAQPMAPPAPPAAKPIFSPPPKTEVAIPGELPQEPTTHPPAASGGGNAVPPPPIVSPSVPSAAPVVAVPQVQHPSVPSVTQPTTSDQVPRAHGQRPNVEPQPPVSSPQPTSTIFSPPPTQPQPNSELPAKSLGPPPNVDPHLELFAKNAYPSARECAICHEEIYHQWSVSAHAYAVVSPMFNKFEQRINDLSQGTVGYFCMRCHSPVGVSLCLPRDLPLWKQPESAREGITCVACHRVQFAYGKSNGERRIEQGDIHAPVFGGIGGDGVATAIERKSDLKLKTSPDDKGPGQNMHIAGVNFQPLTRSEFCTPCHQVAVHPGIKLEVVWEQYRASPACKKGIQCQDCHMGRVPGMPSGYECGPVAKMSGKTINENRKKSNHMFHGPNYSIAHPGVFPFHLKSNRWTMDQWLTFDWRAGWGTKEFEDAVEDGTIKCEFPPVWAEVDDRMDAREIIDDNFKKLQLKRENRIQVMENGSRVEGPFFDSTLCRGQDLNLHYIVSNTNEGHNLLTASLGAQPQLWANVVLIGPAGRRLWETGYVDSVGDVANIHSQDVRKGRLAFDWQLFNLQTMFLTTGVKGTDREFYVPVNFDIDQIPFIRPGAQPITTINHPPFIRMESQSLAATGSRRVPYRIPGELLQQPGRYRLSFRMRSRSEPIYFMQFCFATEEMQRAMNENMIDIHAMSVEFDVR